MRHAIKIQLVFLSLLTLISCSKQISLTEKERSYILLPEDFPTNVFSNHTAITYKNGNNYLLYYKKLYTNETVILFSTGYDNANNKKSTYSYGITVFSNESKARTNFKYNTGVLRNLFKSYLLNIDNNVYKSDEIFCIEKNNYFYFVIRKHRIVVTITLDELEAHENDVRPVLQNKIKHLNDLVRMNLI